MNRNGLFHGLNRDARTQKLFEVVRTHLLVGEHDPVHPYEVCTAKPPAPPSDTCVWEPAQTRSRRSPQISGALTCTLSWDPDRGTIIVPERYWRRSGPWFRLRRPEQVGGGFAGFSYSDCREALRHICVSKRLVTGDCNVCVVVHVIL